ncbi:MAG TPA: hypothetical protein VFS43_39890 [Polyangiaceae bacterium]|nr:hypothetical protein [Polyangiaceae bacterium]
MAHPLRASRRIERRGVTLVETLIVLTFFGFVGSIVTLAVSANARAKAKAALGFDAPPAALAPPSHREPAETPLAFTETRAFAIRAGARDWLRTRAESACPSVDDLVADGFLGRGFVSDGWGNLFELSCEGEEVYVHSAGADQASGTGDDFVSPQPRGDLGCGTGRH